MASVASKINRDYKGGNVDEKSTTTNVFSELGLTGSGELFHHIAKLVSVKGDPRVKSLVTRYNGWYATGDKPPKFVLEIKDLINSELWADPIEYGDDQTIETFSNNMLSNINMLYKDKPKLMKLVSHVWVINNLSTKPYMNLPLFNKYVRGFLLWNMVDPILLSPKVDTSQPTNTNSSSKSAYSELFPDDSDCTKSGATTATTEQRGQFADFLYNISFKVSDGARVNLEAIWNGIEDGLSGKKR